MIHKRNNRFEKLFNKVFGATGDCSHICSTCPYKVHANCQDIFLADRARCLDIAKMLDDIDSAVNIDHVK